MHLALTVLLGINAVYAALVTALFALSSIVSAAGFYARCLISLYILIACAIYGFTVSILLGFVGYGGLGQYLTARAFKWTMWFALGIGFKIQGEESLKTRPAVLISNHQSELDILFLGYMFPPYTSVSAKKSLKYYPFLGWFMWASKTVFIDRKNRAASGEALAGAAQQMKQERQNVWMFPEGTRSYASEPDMLPFKKGAFHLAVQAQVPIVPIVCANYSNVLHVQTKHFTKGMIPCKVLSPVSTKGLTTDDVNALMERVRDMMMKELVALTELARGQKVAMPAAQAKSIDANDAIKATGADKSRAKARPGI